MMSVLIPTDRDKRMFFALLLLVIQFNLFFFLIMTNEVQSMLISASIVLALYTTLTKTLSPSFLFLCFFFVMEIQYLLGVKLSFEWAGPQRKSQSEWLGYAVSPIPIFSLVVSLTYVVSFDAYSHTLESSIIGFFISTLTSTLYLIIIWKETDKLGWVDPFENNQSKIPDIYEKLFGD